MDVETDKLCSVCHGTFRQSSVIEVSDANVAMCCHRMSQKLPLSDPRRIKARDDKLWLRDKRRAALYKFRKIQCPCTEHQGMGLPFGIDVIERHLLRFGRSPECRTSRGPDEPDSSDDEWETDYSRRMSSTSAVSPDRDNGLQMRQMMQHLYQQDVDAFADTEERLNEITMTALQRSDDIIGTNREEDEQVSGGDGSEFPRRECGDYECGGTSVGGGEDRPREGNDTNPPAADGGHGAGQDGTGVGGLGGNFQRPGVDGNDMGQGEDVQNDINQESLEAERLKDAKALEDAMCQLYPGSSNTKLGATVMIVNLVATHQGMTEKAADDMFATFRSLLPTENCLPASLYQAKTLTRRLGLDFTNIDGCPNGCVLFDELDRKDLDRCPICEAPRFKDMLHRIRPLKVLRFFPPTPRLLRFFRIPVLSELMRWHKENESRDGKVRYPADSLAWKKLDNMDPEIFDTMGFGSQDSDVRLQVSCDGICPFKLHKSTWSAWPVLITILNLPPWLITKKFFTILTLLIPGRSQVPFEFFDVWMRPLIDELKLLWTGVQGYDVLKNEGDRSFRLRAAVLYTTHDFPGYGTVSGASHQGYVACPPCGDQLRGTYAYESKKIIYRDARRWLPAEHFLRSTRFDKLFNGRSENRPRPVPKTPADRKAALDQYLAYLSRHGSGRGVRPDCGVESGGSRSHRAGGKRKQNITVDHPSTSRSQDNARGTTTRPSSVHPRVSRLHRRRIRKEKSPDPSKVHGIKRDSIFFELPYWEVCSKLTCECE